MASPFFAELAERTLNTVAELAERTSDTVEDRPSSALEVKAAGSFRV
jgi:hypothetical protein